MPTAAAAPEIVLLPCASEAPGSGGRRARPGKRPRRWTRPVRTRQERPPVPWEDASGSALSASAEAPTSAAELTIVLLPCAPEMPGRGRRTRRGKRTQRWTRPPGAGPP